MPSNSPTRQATKNVDQWPAKEKKFISKRFIYVKKVYADGSFESPSDNAAAFSVIK